MQADTSVDGFLHSLGLEKYLITFQAEEVCCFYNCIEFSLCLNFNRYLQSLFYYFDALSLLCFFFFAG